MTLTENRDSEADGEGIGRRTVLTTLAGTAALGSVGSASAQVNASSTTTATPEPEEDTVAMELGEVVRIKSWEHDGEKFRITFGTDYPTGIKITDTGAMMGAMTTGSGAGITEIPTRGATVMDGMTLTYAAEEFDGAYAITVASNEGAALIRTDSVDAGSTTVKLGTAVMGGIASAVGAGGLSYKRGKESLEEEDEPNAERVV